MYLSKLEIVFVQIDVLFSKVEIPEGKPGEEECDGDGKENCVRSSLSVYQARQGDPIALE